MEMNDLRAAKAAAKTRYGAVDGVQGFGIGDGVVRAYVRDPVVGRTLPDQIDGIPIEVVVVVGVVVVVPVELELVVALVLVVVLVLGLVLVVVVGGGEAPEQVSDPASVNVPPAETNCQA